MHARQQKQRDMGCEYVSVLTSQINTSHLSPTCGCFVDAFVHNKNKDYHNCLRLNYHILLYM